MINFCCPLCGRILSFNETCSERIYATQALTTPYFLCSDCRLIFISKKLVRKAVGEWWHQTGLDRKKPFKYFYDKALEYLYDTVLNYHVGIGYKLTRLRKTKLRKQ